MTRCPRIDAPPAPIILNQPMKMFFKWIEQCPWLYDNYMSFSLRR